jgi:signal transduction histidine kinase
MNGTILVTSKMGQGTLFTITIPNQKKQKIAYDAVKENIACG